MYFEKSSTYPSTVDSQVEVTVTKWQSPSLAMKLAAAAAGAAVAFLLIIAALSAVVYGLTLEDGSGRLGSVESTHIQWCIPGALCDDTPHQTVDSDTLTITH